MICQNIFDKFPTKRTIRNSLDNRVIMRHTGLEPSCSDQAILSCIFILNNSPAVLDSLLLKIRHDLNIICAVEHVQDSRQFIVGSQREFAARQIKQIHPIVGEVFARQVRMCEIRTCEIMHAIQVRLQTVKTGVDDVLESCRNKYVRETLAYGLNGSVNLTTALRIDMNAVDIVRTVYAP